MMKKLNLIIIFVLIAFQGLHSEDTLKLMHPNGGEVLKAGEETKITWEGLSTDELVKLNFSTDNGVTWSPIADSISGSTYDWVAPLVESDSCLVEVEQLLYNNNLINREGELIWQKSFGGSDQANSIKQTFDNGFIIAGYSASTDGNVTKPKGAHDYWILKLKENGDIEWEKSFGGSSIDIANSIEQTFDGGYIIAGSSSSRDGDITDPKGNEHYWIVKLSSNGELDWQKSLGGGGRDQANSIKQTFDGGYIVAGISPSKNGDISNPKGNHDYWIVKLSSNGDIEWEKSYGGNGNDFANSIIKISDGGYIVAGYSESSDGDISNPLGDKDYWIIKINHNGNLEWEKSYGGKSEDFPRSITQTLDGGYIVAGTSSSPEFDKAGPNGFLDYLIVKLKNNGDLEWEKSFGIIGSDIGYSIIQTLDGGYIVAGNSSRFNPNDINPKDNYGVLKLKKDGKIDWHNSYGGEGYEVAFSIIQTLNGDYLVAGYSNSFDGDITNPKGGLDFWIVKIASNYKPLQSDTSDAVFSIKASQFDYFVFTNDQNSSVTATVILEENTNINLEIYDVIGRRVVDLYSGEAMIGKNEYTVDFAEFQSGRYYIKLTTSTITKTEMFEVVR